MHFTLNQAAKETGRSKGTISRYLKNGKLGYIEKTDSGYKIDPSELFRVFPNKKPETGTIEQTKTLLKQQQEGALTQENRFLREKISMLENSLHKSEQREQDLSAKLDKAQSTIDKQTYLITDLRETASQAMTKKTNFFANLFSKSD